MITPTFIEELMQFLAGKGIGIIDDGDDESNGFLLTTLNVDFAKNKRPNIIQISTLDTQRPDSWLAYEKKYISFYIKANDSNTAEKKCDELMDVLDSFAGKLVDDGRYITGTTLEYGTRLLINNNNNWFVFECSMSFEYKFKENMKRGSE